jgi:hypothetical protein
MTFFYKRNPDASLAGNEQAQGVGYVAGGSMSSFVNGNTLEGIDFATGATFLPAVFLTSWRYGSVGISNDTYGMVCGGIGSGGTVDFMDGIIFSSETAYNTANSLSLVRSSGAGLNSTTAGYFCGGYNGGAQSTISKVTFPATSSTIAATLAVARYHNGGISGTSTGIVGGGVTGGGAASNEIDGLTFSTDAAINPAATLSTARSGIATCDTNTKGYFMAGSTGTSYTLAVNTVSGFDIVNQIGYVINSTLGTACWTPAGVSGNTKGYQLGGQISSGGTFWQTVGINYLTEITFSNSYSLTYARSQPAGNLQSRHLHSTAGRAYFGGGSTANSAATVTNNIDTVNGTNDTCTEIAGNLATSRSGLAGVSSKTMGLYGGGLLSSSAPSNEIDGVYFATQTTLNPSAALSVVRRDVASWQSYARGYFGGGYSTSTYSSTIDGIVFGTLTSITTSATMLNGSASAGVYQVAGFSDAGSTFGWISGGITTGSVPSSIISAFHLSNETVYLASYSATAKTNECIAGTGNYVNALIIGGVNGSTYGTAIQSFGHNATYPAITLSTSSMALPVGRAAPAAAPAANNISYVAGGYNGGTVYNSILKILHNTSVLSTLSNTLKTNCCSLAGTGTTYLYQNFNLAGFIAGGNFLNNNNYQTDIDAFDFASEGLSPLSAALTQGVYNAGAISSATRGYFGGGDVSSTSVTNNIDGFTYATRGVLVLSATLAVGRANADGVNSSIKGYFGGGRNSDATVVRSQIDGIDFYDESQINPTASLAVARYGLVGINSSTYGYWAGGVNSAGNHSAQIDSIRFSDEAAVNTASDLPVGRVNMGAITSPTVGYFAGGTPVPVSVQSAIYSFTYSTETCSSALAVSLWQARRCLRGFGNDVNGYFCGGTNNNFSVDYDLIERFVYSTETLTLIDATLTNAKNRAVALSAI